MRLFRAFPVALLMALLCQPANAETTLRIAMTASDIPTTTGMPNNGFEGMRFLGYPIFEGLVQWDLTRTDRVADLRRDWPRDGSRLPTTTRPGSFICVTA